MLSEMVSTDVNLCGSTDKELPSFEVNLINSTDKEMVSSKVDVNNTTHDEEEMVPSKVDMNDSTDKQMVPSKVDVKGSTQKYWTEVWNESNEGSKDNLVKKSDKTAPNYSSEQQLEGMHRSVTTDVQTPAEIDLAGPCIPTDATISLILSPSTPIAKMDAADGTFDINQSGSLTYSIERKRKKRLEYQRGRPKSAKQPEQPTEFVDTFHTTPTAHTYSKTKVSRKQQGQPGVEASLPAEVRTPTEIDLVGPITPGTGTISLQLPP